jgi:hypothetical protein
VERARAGRQVRVMCEILVFWKPEVRKNTKQGRITGRFGFGSLH